MRKLNKRGFTLAELLIVVAIIAVLVAVSIPVFTTQLEKSREETDIANLRSAYAIAQTDAMTENYRGNTKYTSKSSSINTNDSQYVAYYNIKKGELDSNSSGSNGKGSQTEGGCEELSGPMYYNGRIAGKDRNLVVVIEEKNGVADGVMVGFVSGGISSNIASSALIN